MGGLAGTFGWPYLTRFSTPQVPHHPPWKADGVFKNVRRLTMSNLSVFTFAENAQLRSLTINSEPYFVATDLAVLLGYRTASDAVRMLDDDEYMTTAVMTKGGEQAMIVVSESGFYALCLKSRKPEAKPLRKWVTSEVLPAIRKTGRYEVPTGDTITNAQQVAIQQAVARRAKKTAAHYQTIYRAIKARYQIPRYTELPKAQYEDCMRFIQEVDLSVPEVPESKPTMIEPPKTEAKTYVITERLVEQLRTFVYCQRYLFRESFDRYYAHLKSVDSPHAAMFWEAAHDLHLAALEASLEKIGFPVKELDCYKHWALTHTPA